MKNVTVHIHSTLAKNIANICYSSFDGHRDYYVLWRPIFRKVDMVFPVSSGNIDGVYPTEFCSALIITNVIINVK